MNHRITYRIPYLFSADPARWAWLKDALERFQGSYDDVAFISSVTHSVILLDEYLGNLELLARHAEEIRPFCKQVGINLLCTIGHLPEYLAMAPEGFTPVTDMDGVTCPGTCCPNDPAFRERYLKPLFTAAGQLPIDFLWLDDDIRCANHGPAGLSCFCRNCIAAFNADHGTAFTRESLAAALHADSPHEKLALRRQWLAFSGKTITNLFALAEKCIHAQNPRMQLGAMDSGMHNSDDNPYSAETAALAGPCGPIPRWRPGGGAYTDQSILREMLQNKSHRLGFEAALLPDCVTDIEAEVESFNRQRLRKSCRATQLETAIYAAAGCTGSACNILCACDDFSVNRGILQAIAAVRPFLEELTGFCGRSRPRGIWSGCKADMGAIASWEPDKSWNRMANSFAEPLMTELFTAGLPPAYRREDADMTMLVGTTAWNFSDEELRDLFSGGVYCDAQTLQILTERGLSELAGFTVERSLEGDMVEYFHPHRLTDGFVNCLRDGRTSFAPRWGNDGGFFSLAPMDGHAEKLCFLKNYAGATETDCSFGIYENSLGGRVAVSGYFPLENSLFLSRLTFLKRTFQWLSGNTLSAFVESYHHIAVWARPGCICLVNASMDPAENAVIMVKNGPPRAKLFHMDCLDMECIRLFP